MSNKAIKILTNNTPLIMGGREEIEMENTTQQNDTLKKGDLFYASWGYDQTNYDFLAVLEVSKTGKTAKCQMVNRLHMGTSGQANVQEPIFSPYGDIFTMQLRKGYKGDLQLKGSYPFCNDGRMENKRLDSFWRVRPEQQFHETMAQFGH